MSTAHLSTRGRALASSPLRADLELFERAQQNAYHPTDNPDGAIALCIAENVLQWERMQARLAEIQARPLPEWTASYAPTTGHPEVRRAIAGFVERHIAGVALDPERLALAAGATAVIECNAWMLGGPGDVAAIPAPAYPVYAHDVGAKAGLKRYDLVPRREPDAAGGYLPLSVADLERARHELGDRLRMLILTQPDNPTGGIYSAEQLVAFADWCTQHRVHLCVNELYALSRFATDHPGLVGEYAQGVKFTSVLPLLEERRSPYLHWWYSFSKDFGLSGFRLGATYTHNDELLAALRNSSAPNLAGNPTQHLVGELLRDDGWVVDFQAENRRLLTESYLRVVRPLRGLGIRYAPARGSLFVWVDLTGYLDAPTQEAAEALWNDVFEQTGVLLTHPGGFGQARAGMFRIVFSCVPPQELDVALGRLTNYLAGR